MINLPDNWEQCESEHNKHYDPYEEACPECDYVGTFVEGDDEVYCFNCGYVVEE